MFILAQASGDEMSLITALVVLITALVVAIVSIALYFLPTIVAMYRGHHNKIAIFVLNLLLGWTLLGWVVALVWSFTAVQGRRVS